MKTAKFVRKATDVNDYKWITKLYDYKEEPYVVEKEIALSAKEYDEFTDDLLVDREWITKNKNHMRMDEGIWHCLLVKCDSRKRKILVQSEGYDYARYIGIVG